MIKSRSVSRRAGSKAVKVGLVTVLATSGLVAFGASNAWAASCGATLTPTVSGGKAVWNVGCTSTGVYAVGYVEDTRADGKCAAVKFIYEDSSTYFTARACPSGTRVNFTTPTRPGRAINGYLQVT